MTFSNGDFKYKSFYYTALIIGLLIGLYFMVLSDSNSNFFSFLTVLSVLGHIYMFVRGLDCDKSIRRDFSYNNIYNYFYKLLILQLLVNIYVLIILNILLTLQLISKILIYNVILFEVGIFILFFICFIVLGLGYFIIGIIDLFSALFEKEKKVIEEEELTQ